MAVTKLAQTWMLLAFALLALAKTDPTADLDANVSSFTDFGHAHLRSSSAPQTSIIESNGLHSRRHFSVSSITMEESHYEQFTSTSNHFSISMPTIFNVIIVGALILLYVMIIIPFSFDLRETVGCTVLALAETALFIVFLVNATFRNEYWFAMLGAVFILPDLVDFVVQLVRAGKWRPQLLLLTFHDFPTLLSIDDHRLVVLGHRMVIFDVLDDMAKLVIYVACCFSVLWLVSFLIGLVLITGLLLTILSAFLQLWWFVLGFLVFKLKLFHLKLPWRLWLIIWYGFTSEDEVDYANGNHHRRSVLDRETLQFRLLVLGIVQTIPLLVLEVLNNIAVGEWGRIAVAIFILNSLSLCNILYRSLYDYCYSTHPAGTAETAECGGTNNASPQQQQQISAVELESQQRVVVIVSTGEDISINLSPSNQYAVESSRDSCWDGLYDCKEEDLCKENRGAILPRRILGSTRVDDRGTYARPPSPPISQDVLLADVNGAQDQHRQDTLADDTPYRRLQPYEEEDTEEDTEGEVRQQRVTSNGSDLKAAHHEISKLQVADCEPEHASASEITRTNHPIASPVIVTVHQGSSTVLISTSLPPEAPSRSLHGEHGVTPGNDEENDTSDSFVAPIDEPPLSLPLPPTYSPPSPSSPSHVPPVVSLQDIEQTFDGECLTSLANQYQGTAADSTLAKPNKPFKPKRVHRP